VLPHADAEASAAAAAARPRWWPVAAAAVACRLRRRAATIPGRLVGEETEDSQPTAATAAVSSRLKTNLTRSLTLVRSLALSVTHSHWLRLARSFVRYLPIKRRRSLAPSTAWETLTHARTHTRRISERPHEHAAAVRRSFCLCSPSSAPTRRSTAADPRLRPHADDAISTRCIDATAAAIWSSSAGQSPTPWAVYYTRAKNFRCRIIISPGKSFAFWIDHSSIPKY